jgi:hypothetical protein
MEVRDQPHSPAALQPITTELVAGWAPQTVWAFLNIKSLVPNKQGATWLEDPGAEGRTLYNRC